MVILLFLLAALGFPSAWANVEKTIFLGPPLTTVPDTGPGLDSLCLNKLLPSSPKLRTPLPVQFPSKESPKGQHSWYILDQLTPSRRYEVRICWAAIVSQLVLIYNAPLMGVPVIT